MPDPDPSISNPWGIYCDGSAELNPGRMGFGAVFTEPDGTRHTLSQTTSTKGYNNEAELRALIAALGELQIRCAAALLVYCHSSVVIEQLGGAIVEPVPRLASLFEEGGALFNSFDHASLKLIPRLHNAEADALARATLGISPKRPVKPSKNQ
jgi:ribonuclease HI